MRTTYQSINYSPPPNPLPGVHLQSSGCDDRAYEMRLFTISRIPVYMHVSLIIFALLGVILLAYTDWPWGVAAGIVVYGLVLWAAVLVHELGHAFCARKLGGRVERILLWPLGGLAYCDCTDVSLGANGFGQVTPWQRAKGRILVSLMGPVTHIPMIFAWACVVKFYTDAWFVNPQTVSVENNFVLAVAVHAIVLNASLFVFNLFVPAYPLDGSQILVSLLMASGKSAEQTAFIISMASVPVVVLLAAYGVYSLYYAQAQGLLTVFVTAWMFAQVRERVFARGF
jgi:Zn-dependent protease